MLGRYHSIKVRGVACTAEVNRRRGAADALQVATPGVTALVRSNRDGHPGADLAASDISFRIPLLEDH